MPGTDTDFLMLDHKEDSPAIDANLSQILEGLKFLKYLIMNKCKIIYIIIILIIRYN